MLKFISGRAASGKSYAVIKCIEKDVKDGLFPVLLVPEQFSFDSEKAILEAMSDEGAQRVSVISFTRLCDEVDRHVGGESARKLSEADKLILMKRAISEASNELKLWKRYANSNGFARSMLDTVNEFKLNAVSADELLDASEKTSGKLSAKLHDSAKIYLQFDILMTESFIDPSDRLSVLYNKLLEYKYFEGRPVYIDSFKGFTGQQYKILERIISQASEVVVSLTDSVLDSNSSDLFFNIKKTKEKLERIAKAYHVKMAEPIELKGNYFSSPSLSVVEALMSGNDVECIDCEDSVMICEAASIYDEAEFVARNIRRLVREKGCRYSDIVVIARDTAPYEEAISAACKKNDVSIFYDKRIPLSTLPPCATVIAAVDSAMSLSTENILKFHKSGLNVLSSAELSKLENYCYLWNISGKEWENEWDMNPDGLKHTEKLSDSAKKRLEEINALRVKAIEPLLSFRKSFSGNAKKMSVAVYELLKECDVSSALSFMCKGFKNVGMNSSSDSVIQAWDSLMHILDSLAFCFGDADISRREYADALGMSLSLNNIGVVPQMLDEVTFGAADRIRPSRPKYAFIIGANQGVFPKTTNDSGLFSGVERTQLISLNIDIPDNHIETAINEEFLVYSNVCCATDGLFISYTTDIKGERAMPSAFVSELKNELKCRLVFEPQSFTSFNIPETKEAAISDFCRKYVTAEADCEAIQMALSEDASCSERIKNILSCREPLTDKISDSTAQKLFGTKLEISPTKLEEFNRCKFMYFCKNGLRARKLQPADFDSLQRGTLVHYILQMMVEKYGKALSKLDGDEISAEVDRFTEEYLDNIPGYRSIEDGNLRYIVSVIKRSAEFVVERLALEFSQTDFEPAKCELYIGEKGDIPAIDIPVDNIGTVSLSGIVDRLDTWNGYIRVVDYKTGNKEFKLPDILVGQNMQMLIYLYALSKSDEYGGKPAGIFYMPAKRIKDTKTSSRRMNGVAEADMQLITAMEKENKGEFVPKLSKTVSDSFVQKGDFEKIFEHLDRILYRTAKQLFDGDIAVDPIDGISSSACEYCDYKNVCRIGEKVHRCVEKFSNTEVMNIIEKGESYNGI